MLSFFPRDVLDEIWDLIESVSEGFPSYSSNSVRYKSCLSHNLKTTEANLIKLRRSIKHSEKMCLAEN